MNVHENINLRGSIEKWRVNTVRSMHKSIDRRQLNNTGKMRRSISSHTTGQGGSVHSVTFKISIYAMFLDMAVVKGHKFGTRTEFYSARTISRALGQRYTRAPKLYKNLHWLNKVIYGRTMDLAKIHVNLWGGEFLNLQLPARIELTM